MKKVVLAALLLGGCGYHFEGNEMLTTLSIPYIKGDGQGILNEELARALATSQRFDYVDGTGTLILEVSLISEGDDRIGFRYDRDPTTGKLRKNIVGTENRRSVAAQVELIDTALQKSVFGPEVIRASIDYDYVDANSIRDLTFTTPQGTPETVLNFSLGQLDSVDGAHDDTDRALFRLLAQKIRDVL